MLRNALRMDLTITTHPNERQLHFYNYQRSSFLVSHYPIVWRHLRIPLHCNTSGHLGQKETHHLLRHTFHIHLVFYRLGFITFTNVHRQVFGRSS